MLVDDQERKEIALGLLAPYYKDPLTCGYVNTTNAFGYTGLCQYLAENGNMCVAGKCMLDPKKWHNHWSIGTILHQHPQFEVFKPEYSDVFSNEEWSHIQSIHDYIASHENYSDDKNLRQAIGLLELFTIDELKAAAEAL